MSNENYVEVSLETIAGGEAIQQVNFELKRAIENCLDVNTEAKAKRQVILKIVIAPDEERKSAMVNFAAESKLPGDRPGIEKLLFAKDSAFVNTAHQVTFDEFIKEQNKDVVELENARGEE